MEEKTDYKKIIKQKLIEGIAWSFGVTIGFVIISSILVVFLQALGGLPLIGSWIANIVNETQVQLTRRSTFLPN